eukprot:TRINITY_DN5932_c0_g1_i3.p1 TRINITY_DN5932_c0_g1~~TRINITY_DN5932_c0_g1_i3.p1  ORF type:complete len:330 (-),score=71.05 TRINITY_DN5932_c0_g1_i3:22-1011(-)
MQYDVIIVGGGYSGLGAALSLVRARKRVLIIDDGGKRRNRFARESHGFLTNDGHDPAAIAAASRADVAKYPTATFLDDQPVVSAAALPSAGAGGGGGFIVTLANGATHTASRLILATGITDELPESPSGLREGWGRTVNACPYCHAYEVADKRFGVLALHPSLSIMQANVLPDWGPTTFFTHGTVSLSDEERAALLSRNVTIVDGIVSALVHDDAGDQLLGVRMAGADPTDASTIISIDAMYVVPPVRQTSPLASQLGCAFARNPLFPPNTYVRVDATGLTSVPGVYVVGDAANPSATISGAVASGYTAGKAVHFSLIPPLPPTKAEAR